VSPEKFLRQRGVEVVVDGHYTLPNWYDPEGRLRTFACRTNRVSPYRMIVGVPVVGKIGDYLTSYFKDFGKLDGTISDTKPGSFLFELDVTFATRQRIANKLVWLEQRQKDPENIVDQRKSHRIIPVKAHTALTLADGAIHECFVIDMSIAGVAVSSDMQLELGTPSRLAPVSTASCGCFRPASRCSSSRSRTVTTSSGSSSGRCARSIAA
jgi:hypothetical protein